MYLSGFQEKFNCLINFFPFILKLMNLPSIILYFYKIIIHVNFFLWDFPPAKYFIKSLSRKKGLVVILAVRVWLRQCSGWTQSSQFSHNHFISQESRDFLIELKEDSIVQRHWTCPRRESQDLRGQRQLRLSVGVIMIRDVTAMPLQTQFSPLQVKCLGVKIITNPLLAWFRVTRRHIGSVINKKLFGENAFSLDVVLPAVICDFAK